MDDVYCERQFAVCRLMILKVMERRLLVMGAWSANIIDDDTAMDIIGEYKILLGYGDPS